MRGYQCSFDGCDKAYTTSSHLRRHIKSCHEAEPQIYNVMCKHPGCLQGFTNESNMNRHYKTKHQDPLPHKCSDCKERFHRKLQLKKHQKIAHNIGEYTYTCKLCGAGFFNNNLYDKHFASAHRERHCVDCDKIFQNWTLLVRHRRAHHSSHSHSKFDCDLCGKCFSRKQNLRQHMKLHLQKGVVYECHFENCSKFYSAKRNLAAHIRSKHEGKHFMCPICKCKLSTKQKLELHTLAHSDPERSQLLKKPQVSVLLGIEMHSKTADELLECLPQSFLREPTASAESEFSDF